MSIGKTAANVGTSYFLGPVKYGYKFLSNPNPKNLFYLGASLAGGAVVIDILEGMSDVGADSFVESETDILDTRNDHLAGDLHPETDVPFEYIEVNTDGYEYAGVFPVFESFYEYELPVSAFNGTDVYQFDKANFSLWLDIQEDSSIAEQLNLSTEDINGLIEGETPDGYVWHHTEQPGLLQLVNEEIHATTGHTGGRQTWGGGSEFR
jgi:hypothetical protein